MRTWYSWLLLFHTLFVQEQAYHARFKSSLHRNDKSADKNMKNLLLIFNSPIHLAFTYAYEICMKFTHNLIHHMNLYHMLSSLNLSQMLTWLIWVCLLMDYLCFFFMLKFELCVCCLLIFIDLLVYQLICKIFF